MAGLWAYQGAEADLTNFLLKAFTVGKMEFKPIHHCENAGTVHSSLGPWDLTCMKLEASKALQPK